MASSTDLPLERNPLEATLARSPFCTSFATAWFIFSLSSSRDLAIAACGSSASASIPISTGVVMRPVSASISSRALTTRPTCRPSSVTGAPGPSPPTAFGNRTKYANTDPPGVGLGNIVIAEELKGCVGAGRRTRKQFRGVESDRARDQRLQGREDPRRTLRSSRRIPRQRARMRCSAGPDPRISSRSAPGPRPALLSSLAPPCRGGFPKPARPRTPRNRTGAPGESPLASSAIKTRRRPGS